MLKNELDIHTDDEIFWDDSKVDLGYINSDAYLHVRCFLHIQSSR